MLNHLYIVVVKDSESDNIFDVWHCSNHSHYDSIVTEFVNIHSEWFRKHTSYSVVRVREI